MYSLIMMTAMTTAPSGPEFNGYFRDLFSHNGCCGGTTQTQSASNGCCGGHPFGSRLRAFFSFGGGSCNGCCGGTAAAKSSCTGSGYSCCGGTYAAAPSYSCCGGGMAYSCSGSYAAAPSYSCNGSMPSGAIPMDGGSPFATPLPATYYYPPVVNTYSYPPTMIPPTITPVVTVPTVPAADPTTIPMRMEAAKNQLPLPAGPVATKATVVVKLPADAKLYAESQLLELTGNERTFYTPDLPGGREYAYHFKIEYTRNGRTVSETQKINVMAGRTATALFDDLTAARPTGSTAVAAKAEEPAKPVSAEKPTAIEPAAPAAAKITVKVPANGTLYIDGKKNDKTGTERQFTTPPLPAGKEFSYAMKLEMTRNGQQEEVTQKVAFRAGEIVLVDFTEVAGERRVGK